MRVTRVTMIHPHSLRVVTGHQFHILPSSSCATGRAVVALHGHSLIDVDAETWCLSTTQGRGH